MDGEAAPGARDGHEPGGPSAWWWRRASPHRIEISENAVGQTCAWSEDAEKKEAIERFYCATKAEEEIKGKWRIAYSK